MPIGLKKIFVYANLTQTRLNPLLVRCNKKKIHMQIYHGIKLLVKAESHCSDNEILTITMQREHIVLVELLHAEYAHAHSTNGMRSLCVVVVIVFIIAAGGPGL